MNDAPRTALLDVNVLIALAWPNHVHHVAAREWFAATGQAAWATTPVTQCGFVKVSSNRAAIPTATSPMLARQLISAMTALAGHEFWPDDVALVTDDLGDPSLMIAHGDITDAHLLALAERRGGTMATFDRRLERLLGSRPEQLLSILG